MLQMESEERISQDDSDTNFNSPKDSRETRNTNATLEDTSTTLTASVRGPRIVVVMRHGERVDEVFPGWIERCAAANVYTPFDCNMPPTLEPLKRCVSGFNEDTPLTQMGSIMAQMVGRGLFINDLVPAVIYASPAFRCVQTASAIASMCNGKPTIRVEPGLFENNNLYQAIMPEWVKVADLYDAGYPVDLKYQPFFMRDDIWFHKENASSYNRRINATLDEIMKNEECNNPEGSILICAHASTVDMAMGYFATPRRFVTDQELIGISGPVPYCCTAVFRRQRTATLFGAWRYYGEAGLPSITYAGFSSRPDHKFLTRKRTE